MANQTEWSQEPIDFSAVVGAPDDPATAATPTRRHGERQPYREVNLMAPYDGERLPTQAEFRPVQCRDVSATGFSFLAYQRPSFSRVVLALGEVPPKFFTARIVRVEATGPTSPLVIGCQFERRLLS